MPQFKVELLSNDKEDKTKDVQYITFVEATDRDNAISKAKIKQKQERPDINPADT